MKTEQEEVKHTPIPEFIRDGRLLYTLHQAGWRKGEPVMSNKFSMQIDYDRTNLNEADGEIMAELILEACNNYYSLKSQLQQLQEEKSKSDSEVKTLREALIKCLCIFQRLADEGKYPDFMLQANGGEGFLFITSALQSKGGEQ